uniref:IS4/Tn5 family transposase DNA-binding protein n=2 Tax=unclassified Candidatus Electronema TaxID=2677064 RepID=UPI003B431C47
MKTTHLPPLTTEFSDVELNDKRLNKRLLTMVAAAEKSPGASLPEQAGSGAALEGAYRFVGNSRV